MRFSRSRSRSKRRSVKRQSRKINRYSASRGGIRL